MLNSGRLGNIDDDFRMFSFGLGVSMTMLGNHSDDQAKSSGITLAILGSFGDDFASLYRFL